MKIIKTKLVSLVGAAAITIWPIGIFIHPKHAKNVRTIAHEETHGKQQKRWFENGLLIGFLLWISFCLTPITSSIWFLTSPLFLSIGLISWHFLYLLCLPVGWNYFRYKWEVEAYKTDSYLIEEDIRAILKGKPYYLWWH
jgi:hypothetical protein